MLESRYELHSYLLERGKTEWFSVDSSDARTHFRRYVFPILEEWCS